MRLYIRVSQFAKAYRQGGLFDMLSNPNLHTEKRTDKHGHAVTRHIRSQEQSSVFNLPQKSTAPKKMRLKVGADTPPAASEQLEQGGVFEQQAQPATGERGPMHAGMFQGTGFEGALNKTHKLSPTSHGTAHFNGDRHIIHSFDSNGGGMLLERERDGKKLEGFWNEGKYHAHEVGDFHGRQSVPLRLSSIADHATSLKNWAKKKGVPVAEGNDAKKPVTPQVERPETHPKVAPKPSEPRDPKPTHTSEGSPLHYYDHPDADEVHLTRHTRANGDTHIIAKDIDSGGNIGGRIFRGENSREKADTFAKETFKAKARES